MSRPEPATDRPSEAALGFAALLGVEVLSAPAGEARLRARVGEHHVNLHGSAHGGFLYSLADEAFALASNARDADAVALSVRIDYFKAVRIGDVLEASASEEHLGRNVGTYRVEIRRLDPAEQAADVDLPAAAAGTVTTPRPGTLPEGAKAAEPGAGEHHGQLVALFTGTAYRRPRQDRRDGDAP